MQLFKVRSLGTRGIAHTLTPVLIILIVAVGGTYLLVSSNANSAKVLPLTAPSADAKVKKVKPVLSLKEVTVARADSNIWVDMVQANGSAVPEYACNGDVVTTIRRSGMATQTLNSHPEWEPADNSCAILTGQDAKIVPDKKDRKYTVKVYFKGNRYLKAVSKSTKVKLTKVSGEEEIYGPTVTAP
jgi:hypothetical protein